MNVDPRPISLSTARWVGFDYWHSMFGKDASRAPGADPFTPVLTLAVHLPLGGAGH